MYKTSTQKIGKDAEVLNNSISQFDLFEIYSICYLTTEDITFFKCIQIFHKIDLILGPNQQQQQQQQ